MSEMSIARTCDSPYIVRLVAGVFLEESFALCFEYMDGGGMDEYIPLQVDGDELKTNVLDSFAFSMLQGLLYLWHRKVIHRGRHDQELKTTDFQT